MSAVGAPQCGDLVASDIGDTYVFLGFYLRRARGADVDGWMLLMDSDGDVQYEPSSMFAARFCVVSRVDA